MANYDEMTRSNYFRIKSEEKFREICKNLQGEVDFKITEKDGVKYGFIGGMDSIQYFDEEDGENNVDWFFDQLKEVVADDDAILITIIGNEKLLYLTGYCIIITSKEVRCIDIEKESMKTAKEMLNNPEWETQNSY